MFFCSSFAWMEYDLYDYNHARMKGEGHEDRNNRIWQYGENASYEV